jgi:hypothetical protein
VRFNPESAMAGTLDSGQSGRGFDSAFHVDPYRCGPLQRRVLRRHLRSGTWRVAKLVPLSCPLRHSRATARVARASPRRCNCPWPCPRPARQTCFIRSRAPGALHMPLRIRNYRALPVRVAAAIASGVSRLA